MHIISTCYWFSGILLKFGRQNLSKPNPCTILRPAAGVTCNACLVTSSSWVQFRNSLPSTCIPNSSLLRRSVRADTQRILATSLQWNPLSLCKVSSCLWLYILPACLGLRSANADKFPARVSEIRLRSQASLGQSGLWKCSFSRERIFPCLLSISN